MSTDTLMGGNGLYMTALPAIFVRHGGRVLREDISPPFGYRPTARETKGASEMSDHLGYLDLKLHDLLGWDGKSRPPIPPGEHHLRVHDAGRATTKAGRPCIEVHIRTLDDTYELRRKYVASDVAKLELFRLLLACRVDPSRFDADTLRGREFVARVCMDGEWPRLDFSETR